MIIIWRWILYNWLLISNCNITEIMFCRRTTFSFKGYMREVTDCSLSGWLNDDHCSDRILYPKTLEQFIDQSHSLEQFIDQSHSLLSSFLFLALFCFTPMAIILLLILLLLLLLIIIIKDNKKPVDNWETGNIAALKTHPKQSYQRT